MASRTIVTTVVRLVSVNLTAPYAHQAGDKPKYGVQIAFPKTGQVIIDGQQMATTDWTNIFTALDEVCIEKFQQPFEVFNNPAMGVTYPPKLADGDQKLAKDAAGNPIPNQIDPSYAGMWLISAKNLDPVGTAGADGNDCAASAIYRGCWAKVQIEVQAYTAGQNNANRVISLRLMNVLKCYDDARIGGGAHQVAASAAFSGHIVNNSNIAVGADNTMTPVAPTVGHAAGVVAQPNPVVNTPVAPVTAAPVAPVTAAPVAPVTAAPVAPVTAVPVAPVTAAPVAPVTAVPAPQAPAPQAPAPQAPIAADPVIMNTGEASYADYKAQGWTDEQIVSAGKGVMNYTV